MVIISKAVIREFAEKHPDAEAALEKWYEETKIANWKNFQEVRLIFNSADAVGNDRYVFNIRGNHYRLIALIIFKVRTVFILFIGAHKEYDDTNAKEVSYKNDFMKYPIGSKQAYHETMVSIYKLMNKGEKNLKSTELKKLAVMSAAAEKYEDEVLGLQPKKEPETISELVELKMFEHKMTQASLAGKLGIGKSKVSEILSGKRKPDVLFLKGIHKVLKVDPGFLLDHA